MGTCTRLDYQRFHIKKANIVPAFNAVRTCVEADLAQSRKQAWRATSCPDPTAALAASTLAQQFEVWSWVLQFDKEGNVCGITFRGEKERELDELFQAVGPFVEKDGSIDMVNENGYRSGWRFDGKECRPY